MIRHLARGMAILLLFTATLGAHDFWLVPKGGKLLAQTGENFPASESAVTPDRVASFAVVRHDGAKSALSGQVEGASFAAALPPGPAIAEIAIRPRILTLEPARFEEYLKGEKLDDILARRKTAGLAAVKTPERYSKFAKLLLGGAADRALGHTLEIVALEKPQAGKDLLVRVLYKGRPLAGRWIHSGTEGNQGHHYFASAKSASDGTARLKIGKPGLWFVRALHMVAVDGDKEASWESIFVTITFEVR